MRRKKGSNNIGSMREFVKVLIPVKEVTELGGEVIDWVYWISDYAEVKPASPTDEKEESTRTTAVNSLKIRMRYRSSITEEMVIEWKGKQFDIVAAHELLDGWRGNYLDLRVTYRDEAVSVKIVPNEFLVKDFSQLIEDYSGETWTITQGTVPLDLSEGNVNMVVFFYRSGVRMIYGIDWEYSGQTIRFLKTRVRREHLLYQQYKTL